MSKTLVIVGYGPGVSTAVAEKFGKSGFQIALVGRKMEKLAEGVKALAAKDIKAQAFTGEAGDAKSIRATIAKIRSSFGPIAAIEWTAYGAEGGDLLTADPAAIANSFNVAVVGLLSAVQEALPDLRASKGSILITNGAFADLTPAADEMAIQYKSMGIAVGNAAKTKLVGLLAQALKADGIFVGEVMISGIVKGTAWDQGGGNVDPAAVANKFWEMHDKRGAVRARIPA
jgi:NADP-dependent 3-hydroxy acid dehydrogenase YdfG